MTETRLYIARHGRTLFNAMGRVQGWSDTPLTEEGREGIKELGIGLKASGIDFKLAVTSDLGRTLETMAIIQDEMGIAGLIPERQDKRIREWCFGAYEGMYDSDLYGGVLPHLNGVVDAKAMSYPDIATSIHQVDSTKWSEPWEVLKDRILDGFTTIAKEVSDMGGGNAIVVSHGVTISTLAYLLDPENPKKIGLKNGSITCVRYEDGRLVLETTGEVSYREKGRQILDRQS